MTPINSASVSKGSECELATLTGIQPSQASGFVLRSPVHFDDEYDDDYNDFDDDDDDDEFSYDDDVEYDDLDE